MSRKDVHVLPGEYYHVFNRGNNQQAIFLESENYRFFLQRLHYYFDPACIDLVAYCLMPNHFHFLITIRKEIDFSNIMRSFSVSYVRSFQNWYRHKGHLFQSNYEIRLVDSEEYLLHLCRYIHLNPVKSGLVDRPENWQYSDYRDWVSDEAGEDKPSVQARNRFFLDSDSYKGFVMDSQGHAEANHRFQRWLSECHLD